MEKGKEINIILDTNWYVSASINRRSRRTLYRLISHPHLSILYCVELLAEYEDVIARKKFQKIIQPRQAKRFMSLVTPKLKAIALHTSVRISRDEDDNYLLSLCIDGAADYLITGDPDLLILKEIGKTRILRMNDFLEILEQINK